jgi:DNA (cytosine-5)-methyltransferase 1
MKVFSLFSGGGLGDFGLEKAGMEVAGQCEIDEYCQKILNLRWPDVPKWRDIKNVTGKEVFEKCGRIDLVSGGFPCQPHSVAGKRK